MPCSVVHVAVPVCLGIIVINILGLYSNYLEVEAALPPGAEDEIVLIKHLPGRRVHLQDFFWTGAEDAPPWLDPDQILSLYKTRNPHHTATIYVPDDSIVRGGEPAQDPQLSPYDPGCISCMEPTPALAETDRDIGILVGDDPGPRYWLLTVLRSGESIPPKVELRLARLYRTAFTRQQQRHLGLHATFPRLRRATTKRRSSSDDDRSAPDQEFSNHTGVMNKNHTSKMKTVSSNISVGRYKDGKIELNRMRQVKISKTRNEEFDSSMSNIDGLVEDSPSDDDPREESPNANDATITKNNLNRQTLQLFRVISSLIGPRGRRYSASHFTEKSMVPSSTNETEESSNTSDDRRSMDSIRTKALYRVLVNQSESSNTSGSRLTSLDIGMVQVRMQNTSVTETGSTRLIYSVHLGRKPVPAETAAQDMALMSPQEVALELGVPVIIQGEPYLKETRPLALSRRRDAWLFIGATAAAIILVTVVMIVLVIAAKRKRAHSAVSAPPTESILKKDRGYTPTTPGFDNMGYTSETEARTDGTSQRQTPGSNSRSPISLLTPQSLDDDIQEFSSDNEDEAKRQQSAKSWGIEDYPDTVEIIRKIGRKSVIRGNGLERPGTSDSMNTVVEQEVNEESLDDACTRKLAEMASPYSYLSMPSCQLFPNMRTVEPLSKILEPVVVRHLDLEFETPEMTRRRNGGYDCDVYRDEGLSRTTSVLKDPGVVGPIVWALRRQQAVEESATSETDGGERSTLPGPVGRARRRLHELLEDSFSPIGTRDVRSKEPVFSSSRLNSAARSPDHSAGTTFSESRGKSAHVRPVATPIAQPKARPRTSLPRGGTEEEIPETGNAPHPRGAWGSRPMSAGPFHRPNLPEVDVTRVLADPQLPPEDPAVPLIAAIKKELDKFTPSRGRRSTEMRQSLT